ncbi:hypothetical protein JOB18_045632 [Solea senegalensis]|uniref:Uncharacterized protein n=1 Tax=Solea senegalensis TaxID=28829 RepID=A0AAV6RHP3_SOLSE|nr:hypothetical protein JOB18_045632 [Solea senegalensis]
MMCRLGRTGNGNEAPGTRREWMRAPADFFGIRCNATRMRHVSRASLLAVVGFSVAAEGKEANLGISGAGFSPGGHRSSTRVSPQLAALFSSQDPHRWLNSVLCWSWTELLLADQRWSSCQMRRWRSGRKRTRKRRTVTRKTRTWTRCLEPGWESWTSSHRVWMTVAQSSLLSRKLLSDRRPTWPTSPTDSPSTTSTRR